MTKSNVPLTFAVIHDVRGLYRWQWDCINALRLSGEAVLIGVAVSSAPAKPAKLSPWRRFYDHTVTGGLDALKVVEASEASDGPRVNVETADFLRQASFILDLRTLGAVIPTPRPPHGIWRIRLGSSGAQEQPAARETASCAAVITVAVLETVGGLDRVIHYATIKTRRSQRSTMVAIFDAARAVCEGAVSRVSNVSAKPGVALEVPPASRAPTAITLIAGQLSRAARRAVDMIFFQDIWAIGVIRTPVAELLAYDVLPAPFWRMPPDDGEFHADPFPVRVGDKIALLFERYDPSQGRGLIAAAWLDEWALPRNESERTAIDLGCHMSYPSVFSHAGETYCAPETHVLGGLRIFKMASDPWHWTQVAHILPDLALVDATFTEHDGLWWLMAALAGAASDTDLYAWYADTPFGSWTPHRLNPIKSDVRSSRPAGNIFRINNRTYRPSQDCGGGYGTAVVINEIIRLDKEHFLESEIKRLVPAKIWRFSDGLHTFSVLDDCVVIDAKRKTFRAPSAVRRVVFRRRGTSTRIAP